jgi:hypothetical protein
MPFSQQLFAVILNHSLNPIQFNATESSAPLQPRGIEPELGAAPVALDVNMRRFVAVARI